MIKLNHASSHALAAVCSAYALSAACIGPAQAARTPRKPAPATVDLVSDFHLMAQQRPWTCPTPPALSGAPGAGWRAGATSCAWQNRLSKRSWTWAGDAPQSASPDCVSEPARWWSWAQSGLPPHAARSVWQAGWTAGSTVLSAGDEQRLLVVRRERGGQWIATEWRWNPNPGPATRRWQQGRWQALLAAARATPAAAAQAAPAPTAAAPDTTRMRAVFAEVAGARSAEMGAGGMTLEAGGLCLQLADPQPGQSKLPLPYSPADSRLEQRAATHLQLSRQLPGAGWLTPFKLLALPATPAAGAKFMATWIEGDDLKSQLWIPARTGKHTVRVRVSTRLAPGLGAHPEAAPVVKARQAVEHEIEAIASAWAVRHE